MLLKYDFYKENIFDSHFSIGYNLSIEEIQLDILFSMYSMGV